MEDTKPDYTPALKYRWLTHLYEPLTSMWPQQKKFRQQLISQSTLRPQQRILDVGCGPGRLLRTIQASYPAVKAFGLDIDAEMISIAKKKAAEEKVTVSFKQGTSTSLPYPDQTFDHLYSSLMFHHLTPEDKEKTLKEMHRVLDDSGTLHILDFGEPGNIFMKAAFLSIQLFDGFETSGPHAKGKFEELLLKSPFSRIQLTNQFTTPVGSIYSYRLFKKKKRRLTDDSKTDQRRL